MWTDTYILTRLSLSFLLVLVSVVCQSIVADAFLFSTPTRTMDTQLYGKKPPIYISIGPQCSGKTTFLSQLQQRISKDPNQRIDDVSIDDQQGVYLPVDVRYFLEKNLPNDRFLNRRVIGKIIRSRIMEQAEISSILQRIAGKLTRQEFEASIVRIYQNHAMDVLSRKDATVTDDMLQQDYHNRVAQDLIEVVEEFQGRKLPDKIDLFIVEALFRANPKTNLTGVDAAARQLKTLAQTSSSPVAWGNTNTRPREYKNALTAAVESGRQVYFLVYGDSSRVSNGVFLPVLEFKELQRRNINRLLESGKYVPAKGVWDSSERVENLVQTVMGDLDRTALSQDDGGGDVLVPIHSKFDFDKKLAQMANFELLENRTVRFVPPVKKQPKSPTTRRKDTNGVQSPPPMPSSSTTKLSAWRMSQPPQRQSSPWQPQQSTSNLNPWGQQKPGSRGPPKK